MVQKRIFWSLLIAVAIVTIFILANQEEKPFNKVELGTDNSVTNYTKYPYMDTIAYVGLKELGMCDINLDIKALSDQAKRNFSSEIELKGLIYGTGKDYVMWIDDSDRKNHINIIAHELIHLRQYYSKQLIYDGMYVYWNRAKYDLKEIDYGSRPWEADAFEYEVLLERQINSKLY